jgi:hypothetical protein
MLVSLLLATSRALTTTLALVPNRTGLVWQAKPLVLGWPF